jgi:hypothetical protein
MLPQLGQVMPDRDTHNPYGPSYRQRDGGSDTLNDFLASLKRNMSGEWLFCLIDHLYVSGESVVSAVVAALVERRRQLKPLECLIRVRGSGYGLVRDYEIATYLSQHNPSLSRHPTPP